MSQPKVVIETIGGNCPVQAEGLIDGFGFYFRARGQQWSMEIYDGTEGGWYYTEPYGEVQYEAGWMEMEEAREFIQQAAERFHRERNAP